MTIRFVMTDAEIPEFDLDQCFAQLAEAIRSEKHLLPQLSESLKDQFLQRRSIIGLSPKGDIVAHTTLWIIHDGSEGAWYELGTSWVHTKYRRQGHSTRMYELIFAAHTDKNILATTTNRISVKVGHRTGMVIVQRRSLPEAVWRASCVCSGNKINSKTLECCQRAFGESQFNAGLETCFFRVTSHTAERYNLPGFLVIPESGATLYNDGVASSFYCFS